MRARISEVLSGLIDMIWAGLLWILCCLPVITVGASSTALYYATVKCVRHNRARLTPMFFRSFRSNFRQATLIWLILLAWTLIGLGNRYALQQMQAPAVFRNLSFFLMLPAPLCFPWVFAYLSRFEGTIGSTFKVSLWLMLQNPGRTLLVGLELFGAFLICWMLPQLIPLLPGAVCLLVSLSIEPVFRPMQKDVPENTDAWYNE